LKTSMKYRRSFAEVAGFLYRDEEEVRHGEGTWPQRERKYWEKAAVGAYFRRIRGTVAADLVAGRCDSSAGPYWCAENYPGAQIEAGA
jgi:hypothetical protein